MKRILFRRLMLIMLLTNIFSVGATAFAETPDKTNYETVALWHFDEIYTPDATDKDNNGILGGTPPPTLVEGKFGKALSFDGKNFLYVPFSPSLYTSKEITIEAWIYVNAFRNTTYNNIVVICYTAGLEWQTTTRICGIALTPSNTDKGFLRGYVYTDKEHFNEIVTVEPVIPLKQWVHVAFTRSLVTGMHLYVNGEEKETRVEWGVQNPTGNILGATEIYFGHDAEVIIDEPRICDTALEPSQFIISNAPGMAVSRTEIDIGPNLMLAIIIAAIAFAVAWILRRAIQTWGISSKSRA
ncbi:MAG: LamG-like jellyroll fold domain-containing protein [Candidatus Bathyarchaeales archaeon]